MVSVFYAQAAMLTQCLRISVVCVSVWPIDRSINLCISFLQASCISSCTRHLIQLVQPVTVALLFSGDFITASVS